MSLPSCSWSICLKKGGFPYQSRWRFEIGRAGFETIENFFNRLKPQVFAGSVNDTERVSAPRHVYGGKKR